MAHLNLYMPQPLGPLSVEIIGEGGQRVGPRLTMSSHHNSLSVSDVPSGEYTVVATRPSGEQLVVTAHVDPSGGEALITVPAVKSGPSGPLFNFGLTDSAGLEEALDVTSKELRAERLVLASAMAWATASESMPSLHQAMPWFASNLRLVGWIFDRGRWRRNDDFGFSIEADGDLMRIRIIADHPMAVGLLNERGFGAIVIVPPFTGGVDVTFVAAGVALAHGADRINNPSSLRVPVAYATPNDPLLADLLVGLAAPALPNALSFLPEAGTGNIGAAVSYFRDKYRDSAAGVLGALFLARFAPTKLPTEWLKNLRELLPDIADTALLLAWVQAEQGDPDEGQASVAELLRKASASQCVLFARTRFQLTQMTHRYGPLPRARKKKRVLSRRRPRAGDFLDFGADAGGLEAFWGVSPYRPGRPIRPVRPSLRGRQFILENGRFAEDEQGPLSHQPAEADAENPRMFFRETISWTYEHTYTYKKHSGALRDFARVRIRFEPNLEGDEFVFRSEIVGGVLPKAFIPAVEKGIQAVVASGLLEGFPMIRIKATLIDSAYHDINSSALAFQTASRRCFIEAAPALGLRLLQVIMEVKFRIPEDYTQKAIQILSNYDARVQDQRPSSGTHIVFALMPLAVVHHYATCLRKISGSPALYTMNFVRYGNRIRPQTAQNHILDRRA
ncbi:hypothetical protein LJR234_005731 [Mesorhizobium amorphae]|uniref:hypothetical protein n=1 Tax=Mesorhizobium amorphae TaxID=71433 RepID=UPI003ECCEDF2